MHVLGTECSQHIHQSRIRRLVLSVIGVLKATDTPSIIFFLGEDSTTLSNSKEMNQMLEQETFLISLFE